MPGWGLGLYPHLGWFTGSDLNHAAPHSLQHCLNPVVHFKGPQQPLGVSACGLFGDDEIFRNFTVGHSAGEAVENFVFARCQSRAAEIGKFIGAQ